MGITPACAGKTSCSSISASITADHPRLRGENYRTADPHSNIPGSPPLARGKRLLFLLQFLHQRITPACAGKTTTHPASTDAYKDHPRLRGENDLRPVPAEMVSGSPPLARGKRAWEGLTEARDRITPACAGKTVFFVVTLDADRDHPRLRGENGVRVCFTRQVKGSPPLARGKP